MDITVRDEDGTEVAHVTARGRDATVTEAGVNGRRCRIKAVKTVDVQTGARYEITTDDQTVSLPWPSRPASCSGDDSSYYPDKAGVRLFVRVPPERLRAREHLALAEQEYRSIVAIARMWSIPKDRVRQIVKRDDFPAPMDIGIGRTRPTRLWLLEDLEAWWFRDGRHAPYLVKRGVSTASVDLPAARFGRNLRSPAALAPDAASGRSTGSPTLREGG